MKIEIRQTKEEGVVQITTLDERWYQVKDKFLPSITWIAGHYPKGIAFYKWLGGKGWDEAEAIKSAAGDKGSKVHKAIEDLIGGKELKMDDKYSDSSGEPSELTVEEWECIMSFSDWFKETKPKVIQLEQVVYNEKVGYAGTVDMVLEIEGKKWIVDIKTGQSIWPEYELQISAYKHAMQGIDKLAILQVGYRLNKRKWKLSEVEDKFDLFLSARKIWENENKDVQPKQKDYPTSLSLNLNANIASDTKESEHSPKAKTSGKAPKRRSAGNGATQSKAGSRQGSPRKRSDNGKGKGGGRISSGGTGAKEIIQSPEIW